MGVEVPMSALSEETLRAVIEEFVTREGAIHGHNETPLDQKVSRVRRALATGTALIVFDEESESVSIVDAKEWRRAQAAAENGESEPQE